MQPPTRRHMKLKTVIERSRIEELPVSVVRGMAGVLAIDEAGIPRADQGHPRLR